MLEHRAMHHGMHVPHTHPAGQRRARPGPAGRAGLSAAACRTPGRPVGLVDAGNQGNPGVSWLRATSAWPCACTSHAPRDKLWLSQ